MKLLIQGGRVVDPSQDLDGIADVLIDGGVVAEVGPGIEAPDDIEVLDATGLVVAPGLIDIHVHLREPGQEYKESIETGCKAAAAGGFTAVAAMANTDPANDSRSITEHMIAEAKRHGYAKVYPVGAASKGLKGEELAEIGEMVAAGAVAISDDGKPIDHPELMRRALLYCRHYDIPVVQHAEDLRSTGPGVMHEGEWSTVLGLPGIPSTAEDSMVARDLFLTEDTRGRYHLQHLSSARSLDLIRHAKSRGLAATCEVSPHHLLLTDRAVAETDFSSDTKMKPPLRSEADREALMAGLIDGSIDCIASDHAPHHPDEKDVQFSEAPFGIVGLETTLSLCLDRLVHAGVIELSKLIDLLSTAPARVMGLPGGSLKAGSPGDVTLIDLESEISIDRNAFYSKGRNTPFDGWTLKGRAAGTVVDGRVIRLLEP